MGGLFPLLASPVVIDPNSTPDGVGYIGGTTGSGGVSPLYAPVLYQGALYTIDQGDRFNLPINVLQSLDKGVTWARLDSGNAPNKQDDNPTGGMFFDGNHTLILAWCPVNGPFTSTKGAINLKNFDLSTGTWGPTYGTVGAPLVWTVDNCFQRPDGSIVVLAVRQGVTPTLFGTAAYIFSGGVWTGPIDLDVNISVGRQSSGNIAACMDSTGRIHVFMIATDPLHVLPSQWFYQLFKPDNTLGAAAVVQTAAVLNLPGVPTMVPCISGDNVIAGLNDLGNSYATISVGTPLSAPVFTTLAAPGIDPGGSGSDIFRMFAPALAADATGVYALYAVQRQSDGSLFFRLCTTPNINAPLTGWSTGILAFDAATFAGATPNNWQFYQIIRQSGNTFAAAQAEITPGPTGSLWWMGVFSPAPAVIVPSIVGGGLSGRVTCCPPAKVKQLQQAGEALREMLKGSECWPWDHIFAPPGSEPLNLIADIASPAPVPNVKVPILTYQVPVGMKLYLMGALQDVEAGGFNPGDALWTVDQNAQAGSSQAAGVQGLIALVVPLGSVSQGRWWPFERAYEFEPQTLLRSTVINVMVPVGPPQYFVSGFLGYLVPV